MLPTRFVFGICVSALAICLVAKKELFDKKPQAANHDMSSQIPVIEPKKEMPKSELAVQEKPKAKIQIVQNQEQKAYDHWQLQRGEARRYFSKTPVGVAISEIAALSGLDAEQTIYRSTFDQALQYMKSHPQESMRELQTRLPALPKEMNESRNYLIQMATKLEVPAEQKVSLLREELEYQRKNEGAGSETRFQTSIVFDALMDVTTDKELLKEEARKLAQQYKKSQGSRTALLRYAARYPAEAKEIKAELEDR